MNRIKEFISDVAELAGGLMQSHVPLSELDNELRRNYLTPEEWQMYIKNRDLIISKATGEFEDDEPWTDPAGGQHYPGDDPAAMYESLDIIMPGLDTFEK